MAVLSSFPLILSIAVYRKNSCFKIHGMFLLTVVSRAIFCGASFAYYSRLVSEDSPADSIPMFYQVISVLVVCVYDAMCYDLLRTAFLL
jgi:hypothetical protein